MLTLALQEFRTLKGNQRFLVKFTVQKTSIHDFEGEAPVSSFGMKYMACLTEYRSILKSETNSTERPPRALKEIVFLILLPELSQTALSLNKSLERRLGINKGTIRAELERYLENCDPV